MLNVRNFILPLVKNEVKVCRVYLTTSAKEQKIHIRKWDINYLKVGRGPHTVLCMPGALGSIWTDFKPQVEGLNRDKFTVVAWDPPGYGKSRPPEKDFPVDFYERDAEYAYEFMKALHIPQYSVLGWSDGGITALLLAARHPANVQRLAVFGVNTFILPDEVEIYKSIRDIKSWSQQTINPWSEIYGEELFPKYWSAWIDGMVNLYNAKYGNICSEVLKDIKCPTFILYGEKDPIVDRIHATHLHINIVGSQLHLYPDGQHNIHLVYAEDFNKRVEAFLSRPL